MGIYLGSVSDLKFELENIRKRLKSPISRDDFIKSIDSLRVLNEYIKDPKIKHFLEKIDLKKYNKDKEKLDKKSYKNIVSNSKIIDDICSSFIDEEKVDYPYIKHSELGIKEMLLDLKIFFRNNDKEAYTLLKKMLDYDDLYETDEKVEESSGIYDNTNNRAFMVFKNTGDINTEIELVYGISKLNDEARKSASYKDYMYLNSFREYKAFENLFLFLKSIDASSKREDIIRVYKKMLMKAKRSAINTKKILDEKDYKSLCEDNNLKYLDDFKMLLGLMLGSFAASNKEYRKRIDSYVDSKEPSLFNERMFKTLGLTSHDMIDDFKNNCKSYILK